MLEYHPYPPVIPLPKTACHNNLDSYCKAGRHRGKYKIKEPGKHGCPQSNHTKMPQECGICKVDDGLGHIPQHNGECYAPYFHIGYLCFHICSKDTKNLNGLFTSTAHGELQELSVGSRSEQGEVCQQPNLLISLCRSSRNMAPWPPSIWE